MEGLSRELFTMEGLSRELFTMEGLSRELFTMEGLSRELFTMEGLIKSRYIKSSYHGSKPFEQFSPWKVLIRGLLYHGRVFDSGFTMESSVFVNC